MVFHLGAHQYGPTPESTLNGWRVYLNAILVPAASRQGACGLTVTDCCVNECVAGQTKCPPKCGGGTSYRSCDWRTACAVWPSCIPRNAFVTCFPDYCSGSCPPVWMNILTGVAYPPCSSAPTTAGTTYAPTPASLCPANFKPYVNTPLLYCCSGVCPPGVEWSKYCPFQGCDDVCALPAANDTTYQQCNNLILRPLSVAPTASPTFSFAPSAADVTSAGVLAQPLLILPLIFGCIWF